MGPQQQHPEHRTGPESYCWGEGILAWRTQDYVCVAPFRPNPHLSIEDFSISPPITQLHSFTHSFTTLNLSALLGAGHTQSPVFSAGPVWQDLGTLGYINHSQVIITWKCQLHTYQHSLF